jgi:hypothetical protein
MWKLLSLVPSSIIAACTAIQLVKGMVPPLSSPLNKSYVGDGTIGQLQERNGQIIYEGRRKSELISTQACSRHSSSSEEIYKCKLMNENVLFECHWRNHSPKLLEVKVFIDNRLNSTVVLTN